MATIQQLRELFGGGSDAETIKLASDRLGLSPVDIADELGFGSTGGKNTQRMSASVDNYQASLYGTGEALAGAVGLSGVQNYLGQRRRSNEAEAQIAQDRAKRMGSVDSFADVHSASDFGDYAVGLGIQSLPYAGEAIVGGLGGRLAMGGARAALGGSIGAAVASYPSSVGDILGNQREQSGGTTDLLSAAALGVPYAAANVVGVEGALARGQLFRNGIKALDGVPGVRGGLARAGATAGITGVSEGGSEVFQEGMNQFGRMAVDPSATFFNPESNERFIESGIGGAVLGGGLGGAAGGWRRSHTYTNVPVNVLPDATPARPTYAPQDSLTNTAVTEMPGFGSQMHDPLQGVLNPGPSVDINPAAPITPAASGNVAANPATNSPAKSGTNEPAVTPEERKATNDKYRVESVLDDGTEEGHWQAFGKDFFKRTDLNKALDKQAVEERGKDPGLSEFEKQLNAAGPAFTRPAKLNELASSLYASTPDKTAYNLDAAIKGGHKEADRLASVYEDLTGKESPAWKALQEPKPKPTPAPKPAAAPAATPVAAPVAAQPKTTFADDDFEGMAHATLLKLFNGNEVNAQVALADLRGDKPADIQKQYGVSDSQVRKIRARMAPKALELAARQAGVPLESLAKALEKKDIAEGGQEDQVFAVEEGADEKPLDSDERQLTTASDEELTQAQQESDAFGTGLQVRKGSATQVADASTRNGSKAKLEAAKGNLMSKSLTPADLNNLWEEARKTDDDKLQLAVEREVLRRHKAGELSQADMEALSGENDEPVQQDAPEETGSGPAAAAPVVSGAPKQAGKKEPKGKVGTAWDKVVRQVATAKVEVPAWDKLTPEQRTKATDKFTLNGKISLHEMQEVLGSKAAPKPATAPAPKVEEKPKAPAVIRRSTAPSTKEATGKDFMAKLNEAAAKKKAEKPSVDNSVDDSFSARRNKQLADEENRETRQMHLAARLQEHLEFERIAREEFIPWAQRIAPLADKVRQIEEKIGYFPGVMQTDPRGALAQIENAEKYLDDITKSDGTETFGDPKFFSGVNLRDWMRMQASQVEKDLQGYMQELDTYLQESSRLKSTRELKKNLDPILNNVVKARFGKKAKTAVDSMTAADSRPLVELRKRESVLKSILKCLG